MKGFKPLKTFGVRADEARVKEAEALGVNTSVLFRQAIDREIAKRSGKCPTCGTVKKEKRV